VGELLGKDFVQRARLNPKEASRTGFEKCCPPSCEGIQADALRRHPHRSKVSGCKADESGNGA
jgi:hypothetical protein